MRRFRELFDHNLQALRIVEFRKPYAGFPGLNLTFEVREGIIKHSHDLDRGASGTEGIPAWASPPLEAQLIDAAMRSPTTAPTWMTGTTPAW